MADNSEFGQLFGAAVEQYISSMSSEDFAALAARRQPSTPTEARASIARKSADLLAVERDANGAVGGWAASVAARQPQPTSPQPEPPAPQPGFAPNRAQSGAGSGGTSPQPPRTLRPLH
jgi:hypothetical protein